MEFRLPFIEDIQRFQVKKPFYGENITIFCDNNLIKPRLTCSAFSPEICLFMQKNKKKMA